MVRLGPLDRLPRPARWAVTIMVLLLVSAIAATFYVRWLVQRPYPQLDGRIESPIFSSEVTVYRDAWGVPQIYADNPDDLFRAQGYIHAQDRFWEMDFRRHVTSGRLSELFGEDQVETDAFIRTLGWRRVAEQEWELISPQSRRYLEAYAAGVNAYLDDHRGHNTTISFEYAVLTLTKRGYEPEPWDPIDSLAWLKAMAWDLRSNMEDEISRALAAATLPPERVDELYPAYDYDRHPTIVRSGSVRDGEFIGGAGTEGGDDLDPPVNTPPAPDQQAASTPDAQGALSRAAAGIDALPALIGDGGTGIGSNSWVVSGVRTTTGKPLLANDPHLSPTLPAVWYQAGLHCTTVGPSCPFDVSGFTFAGVPGVVIGHNSQIAWGFTNLAPDVADLYLEQVAGDTYEYEGRQVPLRMRQETIEVAGSDPVTITVRSTGHGPLISDGPDTSDAVEEAQDVGAYAPAPDGSPRRGDGYAVALRWTALDPGRTADAIFLLNGATNWEEFREAARSFDVPSQNLVYADVDGNIGYQAPGRIPVRAGGDGRWPVPGWTADYEWTDFIPFDELPTVFNPISGYIVTANNAVGPASYPYLLTNDWSYGGRAARIEELLRAAGTLDVETTHRIQLDTANPMAPTLVPYLLELEVDGWTRNGQILLEGWDFTQPPDSAAAAYYNAVWRNLLIRTFNDELPEGPARPDGGDRWFEVVRGILDEPTSVWWDDANTADVRETRDDVLVAAMTDARNELTRLMGKDPGEWSWGRVHTLSLDSQSFGQSGIGLIDGLFNRGPLQVGGGGAIVNATWWDATEGYEVTAVPSMRMVVDLDDLDASRWINLTGASGHAYSAHYWDQAKLWARGAMLPMRWSRDVIAAEAEHTLTLASPSN